MNKFYQIVKDCNFDAELFYKALFGWLEGTENILQNAIRSIDPNAQATITPSIDIGLPDDVRRTAGGFLTGCHVEWECNTPFIPVDTTVGVCTSSVYKFADKISDVGKDFFDNKIDFMIDKKNKYMWNFNLGNHFVILAEDENSSYLIMHSSASEFKKQLDIGLYPVKNNWYWDKLETHQENNRFIRFIKGQAAEKFWNTASKIPDYNTDRHTYFAELFAEGITKIETSFIKHHYGMPDSNSVNIGCFLEKENTTVPIFSALGKNIFLYTISSDDPNMGNKKLIPHGWGKTYPNLSEISIDMKNEIIKIAENVYPVDSDERVKGDIRLFSDNPKDENFYFNLIAKHFHGKVEKVLNQVFSYSKHGNFQWK